MMTPHQVARKMRQYHQRKVIGLYGIHEANWGLQGPSFYVQGKMAGDPSLDYRELVKEYCLGLYGKAGPAMTDFFEILFSRSIRAMDLQAGRQVSTLERHLLVYPTRFIERLEPMLRRAEIVAKRDGKRVENLVALTRLHLDYLKIVTNMQVAYQAWKANDSAENLREAKRTVDVFEDFRHKVINLPPKATADWPAHDWFCKFLVAGGIDVNYYKRWPDRRKEIDLNNVRGMVAGFSGTAIRKPITLDFKRLAAGKKKEAQMIVRRVPKAPTIDGKLDKDEWAGADVKTVRSLQEGAPVLATTVRGVYDHEKLYIALECDESAIDKMKLQAVGRDGNVWALDHVELFFDPEKSLLRRYQLMAAPHVNAAYDARIGYNALNDEDIKWSGRWTYAFRIDPQAKKWTMELAIPFEELGMPVPQDGTSIRANFGRARYAGGGHDPALSLWSHGETLGFSAPAAFGTLVFEHILD